MNDLKHRHNRLYPKILTTGDLAFGAVKDIECALKDDRILNIALSGVYGSGKSSVIETLIKRAHPKQRFLQISLATHASKEERESGAMNQNEILSLEYSILQQIIYLEDSLLDSLFSHKCHISEDGIINKTLWTVFFILSLLLTFFPDLIGHLKVFEDLTVPKALSTAIGIIGLATFTVTSIIGIYYVVKQFRIKQLSINSGIGKAELESESAPVSLFNQQLDNILLFFQRTDYNVVVFEDLDRFNYPQLYLKLREINKIINSSKFVNRRIVFVYAVKDDIFNDNFRVKVFDYIRHIPPVASPRNSKDFLRVTLNEMGYENVISDKVLRHVATYLEDMRTVLNTANEFDQIYHDFSFDERKDLKPDNLLTFIAYKNMHPDKYALLSMQKGILADTLTKEYRETLCGKLVDIKYSHQKSQLEKAKKIHGKFGEESEENLRKRYFTALQYIYKIELNKISFGDVRKEIIYNFTHDEYLFRKLLEQSVIHYEDMSGNRLTLDIDNDKIFQKAYGGYSYLDVVGASETYITYTENKLNEYAASIRKYDLKRLFGTESTYLQEEIKGLDLDYMAIRLIRLGYFDIDYANYVSYFREGLLTRNDYAILRSIQNDAMRDTFEIQPDNVAAIVEELDIEDFHLKSIQKYQIADYLSDVSVSQQNNKSFFRFIRTLWEIGSSSLEFVDKYINDHADEKRKTHFANIYFQPADEIVRLWTDWRDYDDKHQSFNLLRYWLLLGTINELDPEQTSWLESHFQEVAAVFDKLPETKKNSVLGMNYEFLSGATVEEKEFTGKVFSDGHFKPTSENIKVAVAVLGIEPVFERALTDKEICGFLLDSNLIPADWKSIQKISHHFVNEPNESFANYIIRNAENLPLPSPIELSKGTIRTIYFNLYKYCEDIRILEVIHSKLGIATFTVNIQPSDSFKKTEWFIDHGLIRYMPSNMRILLDFMPAMVNRYLMANKTAFLNSIRHQRTDVSTILDICKCDGIENDFLEEIIDSIPENTTLSEETSQKLLILIGGTTLFPTYKLMIGLLKTAKRSRAYWDAAIKYLDRQTDPKQIKEIINAVNPQMENLFEGKPFVAANRYENIIRSLLIHKGLIKPGEN